MTKTKRVISTLALSAIVVSGAALGLSSDVNASKNYQGSVTFDNGVKVINKQIETSQGTKVINKEIPMYNKQQNNNNNYSGSVTIENGVKTINKEIVTSEGTKVINKEIPMYNGQQNNSQQNNIQNNNIQNNSNNFSETITFENGVKTIVQEIKTGNVTKVITKTIDFLKFGPNRVTTTVTFK